MRISDEVPDPHLLDKISIDDIDELDENKKLEGLYFLFYYSDLVYVGISTNIRKRLIQHEKSNKLWSNFTFFKCNKPSKRLFYESFYIMSFQPLYNFNLDYDKEDVREIFRTKKKKEEIKEKNIEELKRKKSIEKIKRILNKARKFELMNLEQENKIRRIYGLKQIKIKPKLKEKENKQKRYEKLHRKKTEEEKKIEEQRYKRWLARKRRKENEEKKREKRKKQIVVQINEKQP